MIELLIRYAEASDLGLAFCEESGAQGVWCLMVAPANGNVALGCYDVGL